MCIKNRIRWMEGDIKNKRERDREVDFEDGELNFVRILSE